MGSDATEEAKPMPNPCSFKVHREICAELMKIVMNVSRIVPNIEQARPRCTSGIQALCLLSNAMDKAKLLLQHCSESSKLYLALTAEKIVLRCENLIKSMEQSLDELQKNVPVILAAEISGMVDNLRSASFVLDTAEHEAGRMLRKLLQQGPADSDSMKDSQIRDLQFVALKLQVISSKDLLTEKRSIRKLLEISKTDTRKKNILKHLLSLLNKYGNVMVKVLKEQMEKADESNEVLVSMENPYHDSLGRMSGERETHSAHQQLDAHTMELCSRIVPPEEFRCPISLKLMYDPVVIDSGQTYERMWIQKWFDEGNDWCPKTKIKLAQLSLTPNVVMKDLISKWCTDHGVTLSDPNVQREALCLWEASSASITSLGSSMNDLHFHMDLSNVSLGSIDTSRCSDSLPSSTVEGENFMLMKRGHQSHENISVIDSVLLSKISELEWYSKCQLIEDVKNHFKRNYRACQSVSSENFVQPLMNFIRDAYDLCDIEAQKAGNQLLLEFVTNCRNDLLHLTEDVYSIVARVLDTEVTEEALAMVEALVGYQHSIEKLATTDTLTFIVKVLDSGSRELQQRAIHILCNLSSNSEVCSQLVSLGCVSKLVQLLNDGKLVKQCMCIIQNLCNMEEGRVSVVETDGCIFFVAKLLESDSREDQEHALAVFVTLCSQRVEYCELLVAESVIPSLASIYVNGNDKGKAMASELLRQLRDIKCDEGNEERNTLEPDATRDSIKHPVEKKSSKVSRILKMKHSVYSKLGSLASRRKR